MGEEWLDLYRKQEKGYVEFTNHTVLCYQISVTFIQIMNWFLRRKLKIDKDTIILHNSVHRYADDMYTCVSTANQHFIIKMKKKTTEGIIW